MPKLYIISGCNGSGKTTASYTLLPDLLNCREFVNSDEFAKSFSPFDPGAASVTASRYMLMKINYLLDRKADFAVETTLATRSLLQIVLQAKRLGYETTVLYFWLNSPELAIERVRDRVASGGHNIPDAVVRRRYVMGLQYLFDYYIPEMDRWILADNSKPPFSVVAEGSKDVIYIKDNEKYQLIQHIAHPDESV
ncbi:MAG: zeta toxin family protein [Bacteroidales bacterium]|nr:zeta toxin family protein [Bacteroidales bacterium]